MSMTSLPLDKPSATPFSPNSTSSTCGVSGTMVMTMSAAFATAAWPVDRVFSPLATSSAGGGLAVTAGHDRIARIQQMPRHRRAHDAEPDEAYGFHVQSPSRSNYIISPLAHPHPPRLPAPSPARGREEVTTAKRRRWRSAAPAFSASCGRGWVSRSRGSALRRRLPIRPRSCARSIP